MEFRDLKAQYRQLKSEIDLALEQVLSEARFIQGRQVDELEQQLADYTGMKYCVSCANGTDALTLSLMAHDIGAGDAVFVPDFTYIATAGCAATVGAAPVFVDIDIQTFNMSPASLESAVQRVLRQGKLRPRAVIPVDLFGLPADYPAIAQIAEKYHLLVVEDAAQGFGGAIRDRRACSFGDIAAVSFFPAKPLGCYGDGGAIFTNSEEIARRLFSLKRQGASPSDKYDNREIGINSRLDTLQAAILQVKLKAFIAGELAAVNRAASQYTAALSKCSDIIVPTVPEGYSSSWAQYTIMFPDSEQRNRSQQALKAAGIPTMVYYPRGLHQQTVFSNQNVSDGFYPNTETVIERVLSLPIHPYMSGNDICFVSDTLLKSLM